MESQYDVIALIGSLRRESLTRRLVHALSSIAPAALRIEILEIRDLSFYNQDDESAPPASWVGFRERIRRADAVLFATPEYNRSVPGVLQNAIDIGSRPYGQSAFAGKPAAVASLSQGAMGGFGANHHLRQSLVALDMPTLQQPAAYFGNAATMFDTSGGFADKAVQEFCGKFLQSFAVWITRITRPLCEPRC